MKYSTIVFVGPNKRRHAVSVYEFEWQPGNRHDQGRVRKGEWKSREKLYERRRSTTTGMRTE